MQYNTQRIGLRRNRKGHTSIGRYGNGLPNSKIIHREGLLGCAFRGDHSIRRYDGAKIVGRLAVLPALHVNKQIIVIFIDFGYRTLKLPLYIGGRTGCSHYDFFPVFPAAAQKLLQVR